MAGPSNKEIERVLAGLAGKGQPLIVPGGGDIKDTGKNARRQLLALEEVKTTPAKVAIAKARGAGKLPPAKKKRRRR